MSEHMDYLCGADCEHFIFTPHMKEFERISGLKIAEVKKDRIAALRTFVKEYDVTCVLKDSRTTIAKPRERVAVNLSGYGKSRIRGCAGRHYRIVSRTGTF